MAPWHRRESCVYVLAKCVCWVRVQPKWIDARRKWKKSSIPFASSLLPTKTIEYVGHAAAGYRYATTLVPLSKPAGCATANPTGFSVLIPQRSEDLQAEVRKSLMRVRRRHQLWFIQSPGMSFTWHGDSIRGDLVANYIPAVSKWRTQNGHLYSCYFVVERRRKWWQFLLNGFPFLNLIGVKLFGIFLQAKEFIFHIRTGNSKE